MLKASYYIYIYIYIYIYTLLILNDYLCFWSNILIYSKLQKFQSEIYVSDGLFLICHYFNISSLTQFIKCDMK